MSRWSESEIFTALVLNDTKKEGLTYTELLNVTKINSFSFKKGLSNMINVTKTIKKVGKKYFINSTVKNKTLLSLKGSITQVHYMGKRIDELKESNDQFNDGFLLILSCMRLLVLLSIEELSSKKLNPSEQEEFENYNYFLKTAIEMVFNILRKNNLPKRIDKLKQALKIGMLDPDLVIKLEKYQKKEKKRSSKLLIS